MELKKPQAILFDWDNTLVDTWPTIHQALTHTFEVMGKQPWTFEETKKRVHRSMRDAFPEIFFERWEEAAEIYQKEFRRIHLDKLTPLPQAREVLEFLAENKVFVAVVSNKTGINLRKEVAHIGWGHLFSKVVGATDAKQDKPAADPVHMALEASQIGTGDHVWFVGDSITDMECAHNAKCYPVMFGEVESTLEGFSHCPPKRHFSSHKVLLGILREEFAG